MEWWIGMGVIAALLILFVVYLLFNNRHVATEDEFRQAGIVVNFKNSTVRIKRMTYSIDVIKSWRSESQYGGIMNGSAAYIHLNDFKRPMHIVSFVTPNAAEVFLQRLNLAIERCYEYQARNNAEAAE